MDITEILEYCQLKKGVEETFPFNPETLVLKVAGKMFALIPLDKQPLSIALKTDPEWSEELREKHPQITGAYHMNKTHWNSVVCEGLKRDLIYKLIDHSYDLIVQSLTKRKREELLNSY
ncbi:MmcQ/YjbR family DNA-binding protein [Chryseobacterium gotjawalense]|uniref:MmcQ/YjbR family DNA-binding protein n=1 Tax=Chryseobacterium gotjawalense TaxID=3042315 RepID=A0ABY8RGS3_9FLAO|nr:MmcQ/YjbR family DNA-binding protein [Chryseobacterium sp. wdc7]WHF52209.1 MmcQ/YjbR family DNA-binding protein [Chryseobacterium sp. wdc7]